jgi:hypothetical protein
VFLCKCAHLTNTSLSHLLLTPIGSVHNLLSVIHGTNTLLWKLLRRQIEFAALYLYAATINLSLYLQQRRRIGFALASTNVTTLANGRASQARVPPKSNVPI